MTAATPVVTRKQQGSATVGFALKFLSAAAVMAVIPAAIYLACFWAHFRLLPYHGPGDAYMSPEFRNTLADDEAAVPTPPVEQRICLILPVLTVIQNFGRALLNCRRRCCPPTVVCRVTIHGEASTPRYMITVLCRADGTPGH